MRAKDIIAVLIAIPTLALFGGVGAIAWQVGQTWTSADTQSLISATGAVCGGGAVVVGAMLALVVGVPLALRAYGEAGRTQREWPTPRPLLWREERPPQLPGGRTVDGAWHALPPAQYDTWDGTEDGEREL